MGQISIRLKPEIEQELKVKASNKGQTLAEYCRSKLTEGEEVKPLDRVGLDDKIATLGKFIVSMSHAILDARDSLEGLQAKVEALEQAQSADFNKIVDTLAKLNTNIKTLNETAEGNLNETLNTIDMTNYFIEAFIEVTFQKSNETMNLIQQKALAKYKERYTQSEE